MKTLTDNSNAAVKCSFGASLAPVNRTNAINFGLLDRVCCVGLFAMAMMVMRLFLAK